MLVLLDSGLEKSSILDVPPAYQLPDDLESHSRDALIALVRAQAAMINELLAANAALTKRVEVLEERLRTNSQNSSKPPSSDPPDAPVKAKKPPSGRQPGGQPGHRGHRRALLPTTKCDEVVAHDVKQCGQCGSRRVKRTDAAPIRKQTWEIPPVRPRVTEHQQYEGQCRDCDHRARAALPDDVPRGDFGPRAIAIAAYLTGVLHVPRRAAAEAMTDLFGLEISLGAVSDNEHLASAALADAYAEAHAQAQAAPIAHVDETGWREARGKAWLWVMATHVATVFLVHLSRGHVAAEQLLGRFAGILVSDRWKVYDRWAVKRRQICWAHLVRDFTKISERRGSQAIGRALLRETRAMFHAWHRVRDGTLTRAAFVRTMRVRRPRIEAWLARGAACRHPRTRGMSREILKLAPAMWKFVTTRDVDPTNNCGERSIRGAVTWRKVSFGSHSPLGSRFVERLLTTRATLRQNGRNVLEYLVTALDAHLRDRPTPSLFAKTPTHATPQLAPTG